MITKDKVKGMFYGIAIGDALGMPVETYTAEEIKQRFGRITTYIDPPSDHKWYGEKLKAGMGTDDTQLTIAVAESLIANGEVRISSMVRHHIAAYRESTISWGSSTKKAVQRLINNVDPSQSGIPEKEKQGCGNGVVMKIAPIAAFMESPYFFNSSVYLKTKICRDIVDLTFMTHRTGMASSASMAHIGILLYCLKHNIYKKNFSRDRFAEIAYDGSLFGQNVLLDQQYKILDNISENLERLIYHDHEWNFWSINDFINIYHNDSYVYHSLPFSYVCFLKNPYNIETLYDVVNAGGDADTNGSIVGSLLGALNGISIFPQHLIDGLYQKEKIEDLAERFCSTFGIE